MRRIAQVLPTISQEAGGPSVSVRRLVETLTELQPTTEWTVFAGQRESREAAPDWNKLSPRLFPQRGPDRVGFTPGLRRELSASRPELIHLHGLWRYHAWATGAVTRRLGVPLVISPRGMLEPWALRQGLMQKWLAHRLFQRALLQGARCVVVTSALEGEGVRQAGVTAPVAVVPNGIDLPALPRPQPAGVVSHGPRVALFLSRVHPKKGVLELLTAWARLRPPGWRLRIVGPGDEAHLREMAAVRVREGLTDNVEISGPLWGREKELALLTADLFVLPSHSENFGLAIGEALAAEVPVITTRATPWAEVEREKCGWWIDMGVEPLVQALREATAFQPEMLAAMGIRGKQLIARRYAWRSVGEAMIQLYDWALHSSGAMPAALRYA